jgi:hypothetical protein
MSTTGTTNNQSPISGKNLKSPKKRGGLASKVLNGELFTQLFAKWYPLVIIGTFMSLLYIGNTYYAVRVLRQTNKLKRSIKELDYERVNSRADFLDSSKQSRLIKRLKPLGINESVEPPVKITVSAKEMKAQETLKTSKHGKSEE